MRKLIFISTIFICFLSGCEKIIDFTPERTDQFLVLESILNPDAPFSATLTVAQLVITEGEPYSLDQATVEVFCEDQLVETLKKKDNQEVWIGTKKPEIGKEYEVRASAEGLKTVWGSTMILNPCQMGEVTHSLTGKENEIQSIVEVIDDEAVDNFYKIDFYTATYFMEKPDYIPLESWLIGNVLYTRDITENSDSTIKHGDDDDDEEDGGGGGLGQSPLNRYNVFADNLFNGKAYKFDFNHYSNSVYDPSLNYKVEQITTVAHITESVHKYYETLDAQEYYGNNPFSEPVQVYSNVENGAGIVGCRVETKYVVDITPTDE